MAAGGIFVGFGGGTAGLIASPSPKRAILSAVIAGQKLVVVMPALNAASTLEKTYKELPHDIVDEVLLFDDGSLDNTLELSNSLGIKTEALPKSRGYGGNQKACYDAALALGADIVVMVHPDYQYSPRLVAAMATMVQSGHYDLVLGSRILGGKALKGGMPLYKYIANRALTTIQNLCTGANLSEYHTGFRAYSRRLLETIPYGQNSEGFIFDNELILQSLAYGFEIGEISCPTRYHEESSSISLGPSIVYGLGVLANSARFPLRRLGRQLSGGSGIGSR